MTDLIYNVGITQDRHSSDGAYLHLLNGIDPKYFADVNCVFDLGARDCHDSVNLAEFFKCTVHAFEANPQAINYCREHIKHRNDVILNNLAVSDENGKMSFWAVNTLVYRNIGASSFYKLDLDPQIQPPEVINAGSNIQYQIEVNTTRLDTYCDNTGVLPDALFMDIQGAELKALVGLGDKLKSVKIIAVEVPYQTGYKGGVEFEELNTFLVNNGFTFEFCNRTDTNQPPPIPNPPIEFYFDAIYVRK